MSDSTPGTYAFIIAADVRPGQWVAFPEDRDRSDEWFHVELVQLSEKSVRLVVTAREDFQLNPNDCVVLHCSPFGIPVEYDDWAAIDAAHAAECLEIIEALTYRIESFRYHLSDDRAQYVQALARRALGHAPVQVDVGTDVDEYLPAGQPR
jgi:hypothetical protein